MFEKAVKHQNCIQKEIKRKINRRNCVPRNSECSVFPYPISAIYKSIILLVLYGVSLVSHLSEEILLTVSRFEPSTP
jgi:hypothetical protein